jgi:uncharacterized paraquat-inducible protein A
MSDSRDFDFAKIPGQSESIPNVTFGIDYIPPNLPKKNPRIISHSRNIREDQISALSAVLVATPIVYVPASLPPPL